MTAGSRRWTRALAVPIALTLLGAPALSSLAQPAAASERPAGLDPGLSTVGHALQPVVVSGNPGASAAVRAAVVAAGGQDLRQLSIINGWSADVPAGELSDLAGSPGVSAVTLDRAVELSGNAWDSTVSASPFVWSSGAGSILANSTNSGQGVSIAILDTGVSEVQDLAGRVMAGPDLSGEGRNTVDSFGHGTVMAGIAAGNGAAAGASPRTGIAPEAKIVSVKVAGANGATDVSTMLAGMSWVGAFKDVYNIRVLNLSWGVPSTQDPTIDPLNFAVERLWNLGVTVFVAAGNSGPAAGTIMKPADDPLVITVGAYDDRGDTNTSNDVIPAWASQGPTAKGLAKPDLVAPGRTLIATRSPGSTVEQQNPTALVAPAYIKGSGSSEATAVASGTAALMLTAHPLWTPDQVKYALTATASRISGVATSQQGSGRMNASAANAASVVLAPIQIALATGTGSLAASRGSMTPMSITCDGQTKVLNDETTSWCAPWDSTSWSSGAWTSGAWTSTSWSSTSWSSGAWTSGAWTSTSWSSGAWTSGAWTSTSWSSTSWSSGAWTSGEYKDEPESPDAFLTAFFGSRPPWWIHLPGEISDPKPGRGNDVKH